MTHYSLLWVSSCWRGLLASAEVYGVFDGGGDPSRRRFAARRSRAADWPGSRAAASTAQTRIRDNSPPDAATCDWPAVRFRDDHNRAYGPRSDNNDRHAAPGRYS